MAGSARGVAASVEMAADVLESLQELGDNVDEPARLLADALVDVIAFGCTGGSFLNGLGYDQKIVRRIEDASDGIKGVATAGAVVEALNELRAVRIAIFSPYPESLNAYGFVVSTRTLDSTSSALTRPCTFGRRSSSADAMRTKVLELAKSVDRPQAEAIFISCTGLEGAGAAIDEVEGATSPW